jgi:hypothetical protein
MQMARRESGARDGADPAIYWTESADGLRAIGDRSVRLVIWRNAVPGAVRRALPPDARGLPEGCFRLAATEARGALHAIFGGAWSGLAAALAGLAEATAAAIDAPAIDLRLEKVLHDSCRLFHVDFVQARLIVTLIGPGTEYLPDAAVCRDGLGKGSNRGICRDWRAVRSLPAGTAGLFKGALSDAGRDGAAVHRSPPIEAARVSRYLAVFDPVRPTSRASECR